MSKKTTNLYNSLPSLQKRILLCLAEKGPQTRNEVKKNIKRAYKNILYSFKSLEKKGLIQIIGQKTHRRRKFPQFWLTFQGVLLSILEGASPNSLFKHVKRYLPKNEETERLLLTIKLSKVLDRRWLEHLYIISKKKEELEPRDVLYLTVQYGMIQGITINEGIEQVKAIMKVFKKHPKLNEELMDALKDMDKVMQEIKKGVEP